MSERFDAAFRWILRVEGGYVNDPSDPGGETKHGISKRSYPDLDIAALTEADVKAIYERDYWKACRCDELPAGIDLAVFDAAVLTGVKTSARMLQRALGVTDVGVIGPKTLRAAKERGHQRVLHLLTERIVYLASLPGWKHYGRGWALRTMQLMREAM